MFNDNDPREDEQRAFLEALYPDHGAIDPSKYDARQVIRDATERILALRSSLQFAKDEAEHIAEYGYE